MEIHNARLNRVQLGTVQATPEQMEAWLAGETIGTTWETDISRPFLPLPLVLDWNLIEKHRARKKK